MKFTAPPVVLRPNSVFCGPRSTSMRSMSNSPSWLVNGVTCETSSKYRPTACCAVRWKFCVPTPRMANPEFTAEAVLRLRCGSILMRSSGPEMRCAMMASRDTASSAIGTSWMFCSRFCAVTSTSSRVVAGSSVWAHNCAPGRQASSTYVIFLFMFPPQSVTVGGASPHVVATGIGRVRQHPGAPGGVLALEPFEFIREFLAQVGAFARVRVDVEQVFASAELQVFQATVAHGGLLVGLVAPVQRSRVRR